MATASQLPSANVVLRQLYMFFAEANVNEDSTIGREEFCAALPSDVRHGYSSEEHSEWYALLDADGSGDVRVGEFFLWALAVATAVSGESLTQTFARFDKDGANQMDELEFSLLARDIGFGDHAEEIYVALPRVASNNQVDCIALLKRVQEIRKRAPERMHAFLHAMGWHRAEDRTQLDTSGWSFTGSTPAEVRGALAALLASQSARLSEVFEAMDQTDDNCLELEEFVDAMRGIGFSGQRAVLEAIFDELDDDVSGKINYDELMAWLKGRDTKFARAKAALKAISLASRVRADDAPWDAHRLRREMQQAVAQAGARPSDLLELWDTDGSGSLRKQQSHAHAMLESRAFSGCSAYHRRHRIVCAAGKKEWLVHCKRLVHVPEGLYYDKVGRRDPNPGPTPTLTLTPSPPSPQPWP